jgi:hypothetical protein
MTNEPNRAKYGLSHCELDKKKTNALSAEVEIKAGMRSSHLYASVHTTQSSRRVWIGCVSHSLVLISVFKLIGQICSSLPVAAGHRSDADVHWFVHVGDGDVDRHPLPRRGLLMSVATVGAIQTRAPKPRLQLFCSCHMSEQIISHTRANSFSTDRGACKFSSKLNRRNDGLTVHS